MAKAFSLAEQLFNAGKVAGLAGRVAGAAQGFDAARFEARVMARLGDLELKARINWIAECLDEALPMPFDALARVIVAALPPPCDPALGDGDFGDFIQAPLGELVVRRGMETPEAALDVLEELTQRFSMEYAIRPFLNRWPDLVMARLERLARHPHYHVRRLVSEGTRPSLPWGMKVRLAPDAALHLLDLLYADGTRFVTRSVANHLNDISKSDPEAVMDRLESWAATGAQSKGEMDWIKAHGLRTLVKSGDARALAMLGYRDAAPVRLAAFEIEAAQVPVGGQLRFVVELEADEVCPVLVDYVLHYHRGAGRLVPKVMKLKQGVVRPGKRLRLEKAYRFPVQATTVKVVPGPHKVAVQVNGRVLGERAFEVVAG